MPPLFENTDLSKINDPKESPVEKKSRAFEGVEIADCTDNASDNIDTAVLDKNKYPKFTEIDNKLRKSLHLQDKPTFGQVPRREFEKLEKYSEKVDYKKLINYLKIQNKHDKLVDTLEQHEEDGKSDSFLDKIQDKIDAEDAKLKSVLSSMNKEEKYVLGTLTYFYDRKVKRKDESSVNVEVTVRTKWRGDYASIKEDIAKGRKKKQKKGRANFLSKLMKVMSSSVGKKLIESWDGSDRGELHSQLMNLNKAMMFVWNEELKKRPKEDTSSEIYSFDKSSYPEIYRILKDLYDEFNTPIDDSGTIPANAAWKSSTLDKVESAIKKLTENERKLCIEGGDEVFEMAETNPTLKTVVEFLDAELD